MDRTAPLTPRTGRAVFRPRDPFAFFDTIYCINLDARPDRWQASLTEFAAIGIADRVERLAAIEHADGSEGCRLSHLECVKRAAAAGADTVLIFEDDVTLPGFSSARLARSLEQLRAIPDWELFYLGGLLVAAWEYREHLIGGRLVQTHAYAVHRRAFDAIIERATAPFDLWCASTRRSYCAYPMLAWQRDGHSDIAGTWTSRAHDARRTYDILVGVPYRLFASMAALGIRSKLGRRLLRARAQRRLGRYLIRTAALIGLRLRFDRGRPHLDRAARAQPGAGARSRGST